MLRILAYSLVVERFCILGASTNSTKASFRQIETFVKLHVGGMPSPLNLTVYNTAYYRIAVYDTAYHRITVYITEHPSFKHA